MTHEKSITLITVTNPAYAEYLAERAAIFQKTLDELVADNHALRQVLATKAPREDDNA